MLIGLIWGMAISSTPFPRLALGAHIQLTAHGIMFLVAGLVILHLQQRVGRVAAIILTGAPWLTWPVMLSEMANAWWGTRKMLPIAAEQAGATGAEAWQESVVMVAHLIGAVGLIAFWSVILFELIRKPFEPDRV